jgi:hypothetical protein
MTILKMPVNKPIILSLLLLFGNGGGLLPCAFYRYQYYSLGILNGGSEILKGCNSCAGKDTVSVPGFT